MGIERTDLRGMYISTIPELPAHIVTAASYQVAANARNADDATDLLGVLGLPDGVVRVDSHLLACGHPSTEGYQVARYGVYCSACQRDRRVS